jgi:hypothetical protein
MSQVHRVVILNKPLKIRGYTPWQWGLGTVALAVAFWSFSLFPHEWKIANLPVGFIVGLLIFCAALVFISASQMKPALWWRNSIMYRLGLLPVKFLPRVLPAQIYPDKTIIDSARKEQTAYIEIES